MRYRSLLAAAVSLGMVGSARAGAPKSRPPISAQPIAAYKTYVTSETAALVDKVRALDAAIKQGDLAQAAAIYAPGIQHYERIEPIAELFNDLDNAMDAREDDFEKKAEDPNFTGFHRIEKALFSDKTTKGIEPVPAPAGDSLELQKRLATLAITPKAFVGGTAVLIEEVASKKISGEEDRYSRTDLGISRPISTVRKKSCRWFRPCCRPTTRNCTGRSMPISPRSTGSLPNTAPTTASRATTS